MELVSCILKFPACITPLNAPKTWILVSTVVVLFLGIIRITRWCKHAYRDALLAYLLISTNLITISYGIDGYLIGAIGIALWYTQCTRYRKKTILDPILVTLFILCTCTPSFFEAIGVATYLGKWELRAQPFPLFLIWLKQGIELLSWEYRDFSLELHAEEPNSWQLKIKNCVDNCIYYIAFGCMYLLSKVPFCVMYAISSVLAVFLFYIVGYRRKVVHQNIKDSFPDKSKIECFEIERTYYVHMCDLFMESLKYFSISEKEMRKRMVYKNLEQARLSLKNGKTIGLYMGHYANWEWVSSLPLVVGDISQCCQLYHPLQNLIFDRLIGYTRERWGGVNIPANESIRHIIKLNKPLVIGFIADQVPLSNSIHYWTRFLHHENTPVFTGAERLMKKLDMDVYYLDVRRVKRGYYEAEFKLITTTPKECAEFQLTEDYTRMLEQTINEAPPYWLWSHNRWKRNREY